MTLPLPTSIFTDGPIVKISGRQANSSLLTSSHIFPARVAGCWHVVGFVYSFRSIVQSRNFFRRQLQFHGLLCSSRLPSFGNVSKLCTLNTLRLFPSKVNNRNSGRLRKVSSSTRSNSLLDSITFCRYARSWNKPFSNTFNLFSFNNSTLNRCVSLNVPGYKVLMLFPDKSISITIFRPLNASVWIDSISHFRSTSF